MVPVPCNDLYHYCVLAKRFSNGFQMAKRRSKDSKKASRKKAAGKIIPEQKGQTNGDDDKTDFGGLPNLDLKKNLGCG